MNIPISADSSELTAPVEFKASRSNERYRRIFAAALANSAGKGVGLLVNAMMVPIAVHSLGAEQYGLLVTITTTVTMLFVLDIGIANTLTNLISEAYSRSDRPLAAQYFSTAFWAIIAIVCVLGILGVVAWPFIPWRQAFRLHSSAEVSQVSMAFAFAYAIFLSAMPFSLASRIMAGYQELHSSSIFSSIGSVLTLAAVILTVRLHGQLPPLVAAFTLGPVAANAACLIWICFWHKPWMKPSPRQFCPAYLGKIFRSGGLFFLSQICAMVILNSDNLIIVHYLGASQVTPYNVTWRLTSYGSALLALVTPAMWPAYAEAYLKGDQLWMRRTYVQAQRAAILVTTLVSMALAFKGKTIIGVWAGASAIPSTLLLNSMCVWMVVYPLSTNQSCVLCATGRVKKMVIGAIFAAATNLILTIWWVQAFGVTGVILATIVCYLLFVVVFQEMEVRKVLYGALPYNAQELPHDTHPPKPY